jgi:hypothetical protein
MAYHGASRPRSLALGRLRGVLKEGVQMTSPAQSRNIVQHRSPSGRHHPAGRLFRT